MGSPLCSILVVNFNGKQHLDACLRSLEQLDYPQDRVEILLIDNGSDDGSELEAQANHPRVRLLRNPVNNFAAALNLGVAQSKGSYVAFANNDVFVDREWLEQLVRTLEANPRAGCAGGKILFENGRINSVGHRVLPDFHWEDDGYGEDDDGQYDTQREVEGLCWAAVLFRRACLDDVGAIDEDFVMYYEDVDMSLRCKQLGWKILFHPRAAARHVFHGSSRGSGLAEFFSDRNRLINVAKHRPEALARAIESSRFLVNGNRQSLYDAMPVVLKKLLLRHSKQTLEPILEEVRDALLPLFGGLAVDHLLARMQVVLGQRRMSIAFYDHGLHVIGGGQKYGCTMAAALQPDFDVTLLASKPVTLTDLERWYGLSLSGCRLEILPMPFFDKRGPWIDSSALSPEAGNPFETVSLASRRYDVLVNVNMQAMVVPLSPFSVFLCHFPEVQRGGNFFVDEYSCLIVNSLFTAQWVKALWGLEPDGLLYPPADMTVPTAEKENVILSVARFEPGGSKKQNELIRAFELLRESHPDLMEGWELVLAGGSWAQNRYLAEIEQRARKSSAPVSVRANLPLSELQSLYARAKIFWHACGLGETNPHLIEHFGMSIVEAMQNRLVPIVFNGGGQREIVEQGKSGFRFDTLADLCRYTHEVIATPGLMEKLQQAACERSQAFTRQRFEDFVKQFFQALEEEYRKIPVPDPRDILRNQRPGSLFYSPVARGTGAQARSGSVPRTPQLAAGTMLQSIQESWDQLGKTDAFWAILSEPSKSGGRWNTEEFFQSGVIEVAEVVDYLKRLGIFPNFGRALDFGCGAGRVTQALAERFAECLGVDIAPSMISLANKYNRFPNSCRYVLNTSSDLRILDDCSFDFVYSNLVLQHMPAECASGYIKEFARVLKPGGAVIFQMPSGPSTSEPNPFNAEISILDVPETLQADAEVSVLAQVKNSSGVIWPCGGRNPVRLGNHWLDENRNLILRDDARAPLPHDLAPQDELILELGIRVPSSNGAYYLELDMVQEYITWFGAKGSGAAQRRIVVRGGRPTAPDAPSRVSPPSPRSVPGPEGQAGLKMYYIPKQEVIELVCKSGCSFANAHRYDVAGCDLVSYRYCFTKLGRPT